MSLEAVSLQLKPLQDRHLFSCGEQDIEGLVELLSGVLTGHNDADAGLALGHCGEGYARCHQTLKEELAGEIHGAATVAQDDGDDRSLAGWGGASTDVEAGGF